MAITSQQRKAARLLAGGKSIFEALTAAGYSATQARKGLARITRSKGLRQALEEELRRFPPDVRANIIRLRLLSNVISGEDHAVKSAKLLGSDKEVNMFTTETQQGVFIIAPPSDGFRELAACHPEPLGPQPDPRSQELPEYED